MVESMASVKRLRRTLPVCLKMRIAKLIKSAARSFRVGKDPQLGREDWKGRKLRRITRKA